MIKIGCSLYSFGFIRLPTFKMFLIACLTKLQRQNVQYYELPLWNDFSSEEAKLIRSVTPANMNSYSIHFPKNFNAKDIMEQNEMLEGIFRLEPSVAVLHIRNIWEVDDNFYKLLRILKTHGCKLCIEFISYNKTEKELFNKLNKAVDIALDFYHCVNAGFAIEDIIRDRSIAHIHLNDYKKTCKNALCPGEGDLPITTYLIQMQQQKYDGAYIMECPFTNEKHFVEQIQNINRLIKNEN